MQPWRLLSLSLSALWRRGNPSRRCANLLSGGCARAPTGTEGAY